MNNRGYRTNPLRVGAPLPAGFDLVPPTADELDKEIKRASCELMHAIARHRQAWTIMRKRAEIRDGLADQVGALTTLESDPHWKKATGDVSWWRDEMDAQAATILALRALRDATEPTTPMDTPGGHSGSSVDIGGQSVRQIVMGWDEQLPPTPAQRRAASMWSNVAGGKPVGDGGKCRRLLNTIRGMDPK